MKLPAAAYFAEVATSATKAGSYGVFGEGESRLRIVPVARLRSWQTFWNPVKGFGTAGGRRGDGCQNTVAEWPSVTCLWNSWLSKKMMP